MTDFFIRYSGVSCAYDIISKVYAIDSVRGKFLIAIDDGRFLWVQIGCCQLISKEEAARYNYE
jgi:hypothetical protein